MRHLHSFYFLPFLLLAIAGCDAQTPLADVTGPATAYSRSGAGSGTGTPQTKAPGTGDSPPGSACISADARREQALVTHVTDGDSIEVEVGGVPFRVRYIGIDAPEMNGEPLGKEAREANSGLVGGKAVEMIRDLSEADRYGRLLRYVFADGRFVNRELVRIGMARAGYFPPDVACYAEFRTAEEEARQDARGLWGLLGSPTFATRTGEGCAGGCVTPPAGCVIKGNISASGEKIYHVPGQRYYEQTVIEPEKGERWFCTEEEAVTAGWRKSKV
jgi:micrococcal nuclease